jgi:[glutamine synthetase] adenylyltransferase / [glutamine synthetase]-adenylyl-L-tyrosine phosphorylase
MDSVHAEFNWVVGDKEVEHEQTDQAFSELWAVHLSEPEAIRLLHEKGLDERLATDFASALIAFKEDLKKRPIGPRGQATLDKLMPHMIALICSYSDPVELFNRIAQLLLKIISRTAYLELLNENEGALKQLLKLCNASTRVASQLARYPILLDELLDPQQLYKPTKLDSYRSELQQFMLRIPEDDMEQQMEALRQFKQIQFLYIAAADIEGSIKLTQVSDHLTYLSEAIMDYVVQIAWLQLVEKFGLPSNVIACDRKGFAVIGYGKMGGIELGYSSDLDVIFLHDNDIEGETNGPRKIDNQLFYSRLVQRIIHLFSARTNSGILYEIDMRLRPSGNSGILVSSVASYQKYLQNDAWTWEHQALVRARAVFFDEKILAEFNQARETVLSQARNNTALATDVTEMRNKMRKHLSREKKGTFDLKQSPGGMVDIEFLAQYLVLAHACRCAKELCKWSDNLRIFETCRQLGLLTAEEQQNLSDAYCALRDTAHRLALNKKIRIIKDDQFMQERQNVIKIWDKFLD